MAKNEEEVKNTPFGFGTSNDAYAKYFTGKSYLNPLATKANCNIANVNFEPGCINKWHEHTVPQILVCVAGEGWVQEEGKPAHKMTPGVFHQTLDTGMVRLKIHGSHTFQSWLILTRLRLLGTKM